MMAVTALLLAACSSEGTPDAAADNVATTVDGAAVVAGGEATDSADQIMSALFNSADLNQSGFLTRAEAVAFVNLSLISQDADEDGRLSLEEFKAWDAGFLAVATARGAEDHYQAAKEELFKAWDSNGDGYLVFAEYDTGIARDFAATPKQDENHISQQEFANVGFVKFLAEAAEQPDTAE